jgi:acyl-CoA thioester hydrolase
VGGRLSVEQQGRVTKLTKLTAPAAPESGRKRHASFVPSLLTMRSAVNDIDINVSQLQSFSMVSEAYHHPIGIHAEDIDDMGHVNNSVYLKWVKEAVIRYWERVAPPEAVSRHLWIALSHEIKYRRPTFLDDLVVADVIAEKVEGARAFFTTVIKRGEVVLAEVKSTWCCLDAASRKPARLAREIAQRFLPD